jgi:hypothetical protein
MACGGTLRADRRGRECRTTGCRLAGRALPRRWHWDFRAATLRDLLRERARQADAQRRRRERQGLQGGGYGAAICVICARRPQEGETAIALERSDGSIALYCAPGVGCSLLPARPVQA